MCGQPAELCQPTTDAAACTITTVLLQAAFSTCAGLTRKQKGIR